MARVPGGTFKVENNMLVFEAEENSAGIDEFNSQRTQKFKKAADILNNEVKSVEGEFVGVCDSKERVFVAVNFPSMPSMSAEVYEISVQNPVKFLNLIDEQSLTKDNRVYGTFKRGTKILKICSSGKENAAILVEESQKKYVLLRVLTFQGENTSDDFERQWGKKWEMFSRTWYEYPIKTDGEEKMVVDIKCDQDSCIATTDDGKEFECMFNSSFGVIDDGNQIKPTYKQVGRHSEWILKTNCGMLPTDITSDLPPYSGNMRNTDLQMEYKRDLVAMSNKSGVTGYGNQYLVDITTDGIRSDALKAAAQEKSQSWISSSRNEANIKNDALDKEHEEFMKRQKEEKTKITKRHVVNLLLLKQADGKVQKIINECEKVESELDTKQGELGGCEEVRYHAQESFNHAKIALDDANKKYDDVTQEHRLLSKKFDMLETQLKAIEKKTFNLQKANSTTQSVQVSTTVPKHAFVPEHTTIAGRNNTDRGGGNNGALRALTNVLGLSKRKPTKAENELDLENIAHFSAPRENRCTYV